MNQQTVFIDSLRRRLMAMRHNWVKHSERVARDAKVGGPLPSSGVTILHTTVDEQGQEKAAALLDLTKKHAADVWEAIYQQGYPGRSSGPDDTADPAGETSVGPERGSARPCFPVREAPLGGPVSEANEGGAADSEAIAVFAEAARGEARFWIEHPEAHAVERCAGWLERFADALDAYGTPGGNLELVQATGLGETVPLFGYGDSTLVAPEREPTTKPSPPLGAHAESEVEMLISEAGVSPPELLRRVELRLARGDLWARVLAGDLLNDDQAITVVAVLCQELMASIGHLRPLNLRLSYLLELRDLSRKAP